MPARVTILCGPAQSGKTERLLVRYRQTLTTPPLGSSLWLAPTWRAAMELRDRLLDGSRPGCFHPGITTFGKYAETVLHAAKLPIRPITRLMKRGLVRQIVDQQLAAGRLNYFRAIARTTGLVDMLCEFISELKRLEIWPDDFRQACVKRGLNDKDVNLSEIYDLYQQALQEHRLFDAEGRFWSARDVLAKAKQNDERLRPSSPSLYPSLVVVDGFTDFTRTQHEILDILARHAREMLISLPLESAPRRNDLFAKPLKTLEQLRRRHDNAQIVEQSRPVPTWPTSATLEQHLFQNPRNSPSDSSRPPSPRPSAGIEILAAAKQIGEIEMIAARIKRLLLDRHARPSEIAVVFRSLDAFGPLVNEVFQRFGIPFVLESGQSLDRSPAIRALLALLQLDLDDWPFNRLLAIIGSNYFRPEGIDRNAVRAADVERTLRSLQIPRGRQRWTQELASDNKATASRVVATLARAIDALPQRATLAQWANAVQQLAAETGLLTAIGAASPPASADASASVVADTQHDDLRVWHRLREALEEETALGDWLAQRPAELDRRAIYEALLDIVGSDRLGHAGDETGHIRVLSAASVRSLRIPYLFVAGLSEKVFPPPDREDRLYSEGEYLRLIEAGLPFVARTERTREEMLLFYEVITRATQRLYLSYPAMDEAAQPLLPSPFLAEIEQVFGLEQIQRTVQSDLSPVPRDDEPLCESEFRVKALATALEGNVALLAGLIRGPTTSASRSTLHGPRPQPLSSLPSALVASLEMIDLRQDRSEFGPGEGILSGDAVRCYLTSRYPLQHTFAATELERYASCPFQFLLERVLKLQPVDTLALEFDVLHRGRVVHEVLATFHRQVNQRLGRPGSPLELDEPEANALLDAAIQQCFASLPSSSIEAAMREIDRRLVTEWLSQYRTQFARYSEQWQGFDSPMAPELFEVAFGRDDPLPGSTSDPLEFERNGKFYRISGRIDRVDTGIVAGKQVFNVLDYKTGSGTKLTPESIRQGTTLQLPLYALATMELFLMARDAIPWQAGYWYIRDAGFKPRQALRMYRNDDGRIELEPLWEELRAELGSLVAALVQNIRGGRFPVCSADDHCTGHCPFNTVCRINQVRSLEKTCQATAIA